MHDGTFAIMGYDDVLGANSNIRIFAASSQHPAVREGVQTGNTAFHVMKKQCSTTFISVNTVQSVHHVPIYCTHGNCRHAA